MLKYIKFDFAYDTSQLKQELSSCLDGKWSDHFNQKDYQGCWQSIALRSASGRENDIYASYGVENYQDTPLLKQLPYISNLLNSWKCDKEAVRLLALHPGSEIKPHRDPGCGYQDNNFRLHIPIRTNKQVTFSVGGEPLAMDEGTCWYVDFNQTHAIKNDGDEVRIHLVIDALRNSWTDKLFEGYGYKLNESQNNPINDKTNELIIAELERMNTDTARKLIKQLKGEQ